MKKTLLVLIFLIRILNANSQIVAIENQNLHSMFVGFPYHFTITSEKVSTDSIIIDGENCSISIHAKEFCVKPDSFGLVLINIYQITNLDTIILEKKDYFANYLPNIMAFINDVSDYSSVTKLLKSKTIYVQSINYNYDRPLNSILEYKIEIIRNKETIYQRIIYGKEIPDDVLNVFSTLQPKDIICLLDVLYEEVDCTKLYAKDNYIEIK
jgi:hypothetical protein